MGKAFFSVKSISSTEKIIKKSRFLGLAYPCPDIETANGHIAELRKKYYDATHVCYAYAIGDACRSNDDGEPSGTAGMPILEAIQANRLNNCLVVVVRYFGGILLGAGGLTRAYHAAASDALAAAGIIEYADAFTFTVCTGYTEYHTLHRALSADERFHERDAAFAENVTVSVSVRAEDAEELKRCLTELTCGRITFISTEEVLLPFDKTR